ncbi:hypothetical protein [Serratia sp. Se-RSBMAAmG]|uniref:hypothetical protein n=1 Tax=Serratia sp. Se-RSBMAAmG TaxID=3043305 RepID=UPI0024AF5446|nr:hypothetical protein [Serratia sp. Se-RSBMAAmG]MDI6976670.1 hypothetical protein [Serratia sp. Se-RSBMAAmG]
MNKTQKFFPKNVEKMYEKGNFNKFFDEVSIPQKVEAFKAEPIEDIIHEIELLPVKEAPLEMQVEQDSITHHEDENLTQDVNDYQMPQSPIPQYVPIEQQRKKRPAGLLIALVLGIFAISTGVWIYKQNKPQSEIIIPMIAEENNTETLPDLNTIHLPIQQAEVVIPPEPVKEHDSTFEDNTNIEITAPESEDKDNVDKKEEIPETKESLPEQDTSKNQTVEKSTANVDNKPTEPTKVKQTVKKPTEEPKPIKKVRKEPKKDIWELEADKKLQELNDALK